MANGNPARTGRTTARTLFLSDLHLGFRHARVRELNEFLHGIGAERIVLVGDIVDALSLARRAFWTAEHTQVVRTLLARQRAGARLIYIPGNHDASLAMLAQMLQGQFEVHREWVHRTARGERLLVLHGDQFDGVVPCPRWLTRLGDALHDATVMVERLAARHARTQGYDGVVCRHIHRANLRHIEGTLYGNTGDWVESCSALIESEQGELQLLRWPHAARAALRPADRLVADAA